MNTPTRTTPTGIDPHQAAHVAPLAPAQLVADTDAGGVRLSWPATGEDIEYYQCLRRSSTSDQWEPIGQTTPPDLAYLDHNPGAGLHVYGVQAVNAYGTVSAITESQPIQTS